MSDASQSERRLEGSVLGSERRSGLNLLTSQLNWIHLAPFSWENLWNRREVGGQRKLGALVHQGQTWTETLTMAHPR